MRITSDYLYRMSVDTLTEGYERIARIQGELGSGVQLTEAGRDPLSMEMVTCLQGKLDEMARSKQRATDVRTELTLEQEQLKAYGHVLLTLRNIVKRAANGVNSQEDMQSFASRVRHCMMQLIPIANTQNFEGKSIFAGSRTHTKAWQFEMKANEMVKAIYLGDQQQRKIPLASGLIVRIYQPGTAFFGAKTRSIFARMSQFAKRLEQGRGLSPSETSTTLDALDGFQKRCRMVLDEVLGNHHLSDFEARMHSAFNNDYLKTLANLRDANYAMIVSHLAREMTLLKGVMKASVELQKLSIFDHM